MQENIKVVMKLACNIKRHGEQLSIPEFSGSELHGVDEQDLQDAHTYLLQNYVAMCEVVPKLIPKFSIPSSACDTNNRKMKMNQFMQQHGKDPKAAMLHGPALARELHLDLSMLTTALSPFKPFPPRSFAFIY